MGGLVWTSDYDKIKKGSVDWYDYKKLAGFIFPPAGEKVQFARVSHPWTDGEVIGMNSRGECVIEHADGFCSVHLEEDIRPMDWNKEKVDCAELLAVVSDAIHRNQGNENTIGAIVQAILAAGYRKCNNN